ncbi:MAG TPA: hypothetical protein VGJ29_13395 [Vicinamibacterales bacterium]|jgi:hypothetical protein
MPTLEVLAKRASHVATVADYTRIKCQIDGLKWNPSWAEGLLDDEAIGILAHWGGERAVAEAKAACDAALSRTVDPPAPVAASSGARVLTTDDVDLDAIADVLVRSIKAAIAPLKEKIAQLDATIADLEARDSGVSIEYRGIFAQGTVYPKGSACTRDGSLWLALRDTGLAPGTSPTCWKLIVKSGGAR